MKGFYDVLIPEVRASLRWASEEEIALYFLERFEQCIEHGELAFIAMDVPGYLAVRKDVAQRLNRIIGRADALRHKLVNQAQQQDRSAAQGVVEGVHLPAQAGDFGAKAGNLDGEFLGGFVVHHESVAREGE